MDAFPQVSPAWSLLLLAGGLILIWWDLKRTRPATVPASTLAAASDGSTELQTVAKLAIESPSEATDIAWSFDDPGVIYFLGMSGPGTKTAISSFQVQGTNRTGGPLKDIGGYVRSDKSNKEYPLITLKEYPLGIPRDLQFHIVAPFAGDGQSIPFETFLHEVGPLTLVFHYNGKTYTKHFPYNQVRQSILDFAFGKWNEK